MSKMFKPKINTPAAAQAPTAPKAEAPRRELGGEKAQDLQKKRKRGRNSLRIDPQSGGLGGGGKSGVNVPMK
jgi:hypothetical protein